MWGCSTRFSIGLLNPSPNVQTYIWDKHTNHSKIIWQTLTVIGSYEGSSTGGHTAIWCMRVVSVILSRRSCVITLTTNAGGLNSIITELPVNELRYYTRRLLTHTWCGKTIMVNYMAQCGKGVTGSSKQDVIVFLLQYDKYRAQWVFLL